jgi:hypothetical protein
MAQSGNRQLNTSNRSASKDADYERGMAEKELASIR